MNLTLNILGAITFKFFFKEYMQSQDFLKYMYNLTVSLRLENQCCRWPKTVKQNWPEFRCILTINWSSSMDKPQLCIFIQSTHRKIVHMESPHTAHTIIIYQGFIPVTACKYIHVWWKYVVLHWNNKYKYQTVTSHVIKKGEFNRGRIFIYLQCFIS